MDVKKLPECFIVSDNDRIPIVHDSSTLLWVGTFNLHVIW